MTKIGQKENCAMVSIHAKRLQLFYVFICILCHIEFAFRTLEQLKTE